jgi:ribosome-associated heat shock protein Hsp15
MRLDIWLDVACLCKTRTDAKKHCEGGKVDVNGHSAKPHRELKIGDVIDLSRPHGQRQRVIVRAFAEQHIPKSEARTLYEDVTPEPTPEVKAMLELARLAGPRPIRGQAAPAWGKVDKYEKRRRRGAKERGEV